MSPDTTSPARHHPREIAGHHVSPVPLVAAFALLGGAIAAAVATGSPWWLIAIGIVGPDLTFLAAIGQTPAGPGLLPRRAVRPYNAAHHPGGPAVLLVLALAAAWWPVAVLAVAWASHLAWDHGVGYRLRAADGSIREPRGVPWTRGGARS